MKPRRLVLKFGGTSVGDSRRIRNAAEIVLAVRDRDPAVVVSAAAGVTDSLVRLLDVAQGGEGSAPILDEIENRHRTLVEELNVTPELLDRRFAELRDLTRGIELLREITPRTCDLVLSYGEYLLAPVFAEHLTNRGLPARAWVAGDLGLVTDDRFTRARPLPESYDRIAATLAAADDHVPVVTGFLGRTSRGQATTLGRGGSDYTASIVARAVNAEELQIWTDVDGILTADPRLVPQARLVERLSFGEASELAYSGAKVLHPSTITPAMEGKIPVRVLNTLAPERPGTLILESSGREGARVLRSIVHKLGVRAITIVSPRMLARHGFVSKIAEVFDRHGCSIDMVSTSEISLSITTDEPPLDMAALVEELETFASVQVEASRGMVSVVGGRLGDDVALIGEIFQRVAEVDAGVEMISYGATKTNLSFLLAEEAVPRVVAALHRAYFEGP